MSRRKKTAVVSLKKKRERERELEVNPPDITTPFVESQTTKGCTVELLPEGPEYVVSVSARNIKYTLYREERVKNATRWGDPVYPKDRGAVPMNVVREKLPNGEYKRVGIYRHIQMLGGSLTTYLPEDDRFVKSSGDTARVVQVTRGPIRVFTHPSDSFESSLKE